MRHASPEMLALDLGTQCGWALLSKGKVVSSTFDMRPSEGELPGVRFLKFEREFLPTFRNVREIWFEKVRRHEGTHAAHIYGGFWAILCAFCAKHDIRLFECEVSQIKQHIIGKGRASKAQIIEAMKNRGFAPGDDNEADALAILSFARKQRSL